MEVFCLSYASILIIISIRIFVLSIRENKDMIAFSLIFMMLMRVVMFPSVIYMSIVIFIKYKSLEEELLAESNEDSNKLVKE